MIPEENESPGAVLSTLLVLGGVSWAQPTIQDVVNAASYIPDSLPSAGIAQGAMFVVEGSNLGPSSYEVAQAFPLSTAIAGTSVAITAGGSTFPAIMYYAGPSQIAAILSSAAPIGAATLTVAYNGRTSSAFPIAVVANALGIFTVSQSGSGDAIATRGATFVSPTNAANANDVIAFWEQGWAR